MMIDLVGLTRDRDQLWDEAAAIEAGSESLVIPERLWRAAAIEAQIRAGYPDLEGLCLALADWSGELRMLLGRAGSTKG